MSNTLPIDYVYICAAKRRRKAFITKHEKFLWLIVLSFILIIMTYLQTLSQIRTLPHSNRSVPKSTVRLERVQKQIATPITPTQIIKEVWGDASATGIAIAKCESHLNPQAINTNNSDGIFDYGLFQLHGQQIMDARENAQRAFEMFKARGVEPWYSSEQCWGY